MTNQEDYERVREEIARALHWYSRANHGSFEEQALPFLNMADIALAANGFGRPGKRTELCVRCGRLRSIAHLEPSPRGLRCGARASCKVARKQRRKGMGGVGVIFAIYDEVADFAPQ